MSNFSLVDKYTPNTSIVPKALVKNSLIVANSLLLSGDVNLNKAKDKVPMVTGKTTNTSGGDYKRLTRYFDLGKIEADEDRVAYNQLMSYLRTLSWLVLFDGCKDKGGVLDLKKVKYLLLDGTKWDFGEYSIHLLTLCVTVGDVAIPIWWEDLEKAGHSSQAERIAYLKAAMECYQLTGLTLIADREYIGIEWFRELEAKEIRFIIRVKEGIYHDDINKGGGLSWDRLKAKAQSKPKGKKVAKRIDLQGLDLWYVILKNPRPDAGDKLVFLLTNWESPTQAAKVYRLRWQIEVCFKHLKSNGFNLEKMAVEGKEKRHLMMAVSVLIYILAIREGIILERSRHGAIPHKTDKRDGYSYRAESVFRKGLSILLRKCVDAGNLARYLETILKPKFHGILENV